MQFSLMPTIKKTICPLDCPDTCGLLATVENGKVISLAGDPEHPYTNGFICRKMRRYPERLYSQKRILYPQVRTGKKGEGRFKRISWEEAWEHLVPNLQATVKEYGGEAILPFSYAGNMGLVNRFAGFPLFHKMGATQYMQTICSAAARAGWKMNCGKAGGSPPDVAAKSSLIIAWGINVRVSNVHFWQYVTKARKAGARLLVIDPYCNDTARSADEYIQVTPGGDTALSLGILKILAEKQWLDRSFISSETEGFEHLQRYLQQTSLAEFEQQSGVSTKQMLSVASLLRENPKTFIRIGIGLTRNSRGGMAVRAISSLAAGCGLFDGQPGRGILLSSGAFSADQTKLTFPELAARQSRTINMIHLGQALTSADPAVKTLIVYNANPVSVVPDGTTVRRGLCREDLFTIVHEQVMTPTAKFADLLLPATTFLENRDFYSAYGHFYLGVADKVIEPIAEAMSNFDFFQTLAQKMGYTDPPFQQSLNDRLTAYFNSVRGVPADFCIDDYQDGQYVLSEFGRQDGSMLARVGERFRFYNDADPTQPGIPCLKNGAEFDQPDLLSRFPYKLITPPNDKLLNSTFGEMYDQEQGDVIIHPDDAAEMNIQPGSRVRLQNFRGSVYRKALVSKNTQRGLVVAEGIYWPGPGQKEGINDLVSQKCSDMGGGALFHESRVQLESVDDIG